MRPYHETCGVGVGDPGSPGGPGDPGGDPGGGGGGGGGGQDNVCHNTDPNHGCNPCPPGATLAQTPDPAACLAWDQNLFCSELNPAGLSYEQWISEQRSFGCLANPYNPGSPAVAAHKALALIHFPKPSGDRSVAASVVCRLSVHLGESVDLLLDRSEYLEVLLGNRNGR